jgi:hypothetical protein
MKTTDNKFAVGSRGNKGRNTFRWAFGKQAVRMGGGWNWPWY